MYGLPAKAQLVTGEHRRLPVERLGVDAPALLLHLPLVLLNHSVREHEVVLPLILLEHIESLARLEHVGMDNGCLVRNFVDADFLIGVQQKLHDRLGPVCAVAEKTQVGKRLLGAAELVFPLGQLVGELDQQTPKTAALVLW